jgi:hypothetical protein
LVGLLPKLRVPVKIGHALRNVPAITSRSHDPLGIAR